MAVQAQYPINALFLNRNLQESGKPTNFSIHPQTEEECLGQLNNNGKQYVNHNNNVINQRKRGRDTSSALATTPIDSFPTIPQSQHQQPPMLNIPQLHQSHNPLLSNGLKLSTNHQKQQDHHETNPNPNRSSFLSDHIHHQMKQHQHEIHQLLHFQGQQLQRVLSEKRQRQYQSLLTAAHESLQHLLIEKQSKLEKAVRRNAELEARAVQLSMESQFWQAKARAHESTAASMQSKLQQALIYKGSRIGDGVEQQQQSRADDAESVYIDPDRVVVAELGSRFKTVCKACRRRNQITCCAAKNCEIKRRHLVLKTMSF